VKKTTVGKLKNGWAVALACVALAAGGIVLLQAPGHAAPRAGGGGAGSGASAGPGASGGTFTARGPTRATLSGPLLSGHVALSQGALLANGTRRLLAEVRLSADDDARGAAERQPVALAVVLDVSGSMHGEKIAEAKNAVRQLVERMHDEDWVALVTYDHQTRVVQPLAPVASVRGELSARIDAIAPGGGTSIPQALDAGARSLEGAPGHLIRRLVLLSDGLDGSGQPVEAVSAQVRRRASGGVATSALGIGRDYDERFMTSVADAGRGNYEFLASGAQLQRFLRRELDEASSTVVDRVLATLTLPAGFRIRAVYGAEATGRTGEVQVAFGPLSAGDSRRAVLDLEVRASAPGSLGELGAAVAYRAVASGARHRVDGAALAVAAVADEAQVTASRDEAIYGRTWAAAIDHEQREAIEAWRQGDVRRAQTLARENQQQARRVAAEAPAAAPALEEMAAEFEADEESFGALDAASGAGRGYGLRRNAARRARTRR
jgi:Ca-activated chloride channel family protein